MYLVEWQFELMASNRQALYQRAMSPFTLAGGLRFEPVTSPLSGARSNN
jgi:hypothetical protein